MAMRRSATWLRSWTFRLIGPSMAIALASGAAEARSQGPETIDIAASTLPEALAELSREASVSIGSDRPLARLHTPRLRGKLSIEEALRRLLAGTGYRARRVGNTAWRIEPAPTPSQPEPRPRSQETAIGPAIALTDP